MSRYSIHRWRLAKFIATLAMLSAGASSTAQEQAASATQEQTTATVGASLIDGDPQLPAQQLAPVATEESAEDLLRNQELAEIEQIKRKLGGSILRGSILDPNDESLEAASNQEIRRAVGLPRSDNRNANRPQVARSKSVAGASPLLVSPSESGADGHGSQDAMYGVVIKLRTRVLQLETIAHQLESIRHYDVADDLRDAAAELRMIARQLDPRPAGSR